MNYFIIFKVNYLIYIEIIEEKLHSKTVEGSNRRNIFFELRIYYWFIVLKNIGTLAYLQYFIIICIIH